jgi:polysaccharide biosynthesis transport protein
MDNDNQVPMEGGAFEESANLRHYWHVILERRWLVLTTFVSVFVLCLIYLYKAPRIYRAETRIQIDRETESTILFRENISMDSRDQDYLQTQYKNLLSRTLIQFVVDKLNLSKDIRYATAPDIAKRLSEDISVVPIRLSRLVDIRIEHTESRQAVNIATNLVNRFLENNLDMRRMGSVSIVTWLNQEILAQQIKVQEADALIQNYKKELNNISVEESQNIVYQSLKVAQQQLVEARAKSFAAQKVQEEIEKLMKEMSPESIPQVKNDRVIQELTVSLGLKESELASLKKRYRDKHPMVMTLTADIQKLRDSMRQQAESIITSIANETKLAKATEEGVKIQVEALNGDVLKLGEAKVKYDAYVRDAEQKRKLLDNLVLRRQESEVTQNNKVNNIKVIDEAVPPVKPVKPRVILTLLLGLFGGIAAGCALAFFVNYMDDSIKTQEDVEIYLRLPFLGYVSNIKSNSVIERDLQAHQHPQSTAAEGFRTIRAAITLMPNGEKYRLVSITSTIPSEGKSLMASNLAIVTAQTGLKTLLVDGDLRRPSVHKAFQLHSPLGLSSYLQGKVENLDEILHPTEVPNLDVACAGAVPSTPSELIGSKRMRQFLQEVTRRYDRVFVDCPPISAVSDPLVVAAMSDGVVFVTKFNKIRREHARKSIQRVQDAGIRILGVVLNDIDFEGKDSYYYSYYYYQNRYYSSHYKSKKKPEDANKPKPDASVKNA